MKKEETYKCLKDTPTGSYKAGVITDNPLCADFPEYFAKYAFTTEDGVDYYDEGKPVFSPNGSSTFGILAATSSLNPSCVYFSTPEAAQAYLDEQNKPKFEVGDVIGSNNVHDKFLVMVTALHGEKHFSGYGFSCVGNWMNNETERMYHYGLLKKTPEEWESALIKEAERRGLNKPCIVKGLLEDDFTVTIKEDAADKGFDVYSFKTHLSFNGVCVMCNGKWASIISEPEKEKTTAEWIDEYEDGDTDLSQFVKKYNLIITKAPSNA